jgi:PAS domain S-box-containing protein
MTEKVAVAPTVVGHRGRRPKNIEPHQPFPPLARCRCTDRTQEHQTVANKVEFVRRQRALADFGEFTLRCDDLQAVLDEGCRLVAGALGADLAKVVRIEADQGTGLVCAGIGWKPGVVGEMRISLGERSSITFALDARKPVVMPDIDHEERFDLPQFLCEHGVAALVNVPIFLPGGSPFGILEVDARHPREFEEEDVEFLRAYCALVGPVIDRLDKIGELERNNERFRLIVDNARDYVIILSDADDRITDWLPGAETILGWSEEEMLGRPIADIFTPEDRASGAPKRETDAALANGASPDVRWHTTKGQGRVFLDGQTIAMHHHDGTLRGFLKIGQDVTERKRDEERRSILLAELQHRVRNVLALVASVVKRGDASGTVEEFRSNLSGRVAALARTQTLLTRGVGVGVDLETIIMDEISAQGADEARLTVAGPRILLSAKAAEVLTLGIHELVTNACKYGAFHHEAGKVAVVWQVRHRDGQEWLDLRWEESGFAIAARADRRKGFGTELITRRVPYELMGQGSIDLHAEGLRCNIGFPLVKGESILQTDIPAALDEVQEIGRD